MRTCSRRPRGVLTAEVLTTLAITAMLMLATGAATQSACQNAAVNEGQFVATRTSRQMAQTLARTIRCAAACQIGSGAAADSSKTGSILYVSSSSGALSAYVYDAANHRLLLDNSPALPTTDTPDLSDIRSRMQGEAPSVVVLGDGVTSLTFQGEYANRPDPEDPSANLSTLVNVQINMEVTQQDQAMRLCESVIPRRTQQ